MSPLQNKVFTIGECEMRLILDVLEFLAFALLVSAIILAALSANEQQRQIDEFSEAIVSFAQNHEGATDHFGILGGADYEVVFVDYSKKLAVLTRKDEAGTQWEIHRNVSPSTLKEWSLKRHFRG